MRVRAPFAATFAGLLLFAGYAGLSSVQGSVLLNDKAIHFVTFFALTLCFYWILDTSRRRVLNYTLVACTGGLAIGSEIVQGFLPNGRVFDLFDILANVLGSLGAVALCSWYHQRMLERKRAVRRYSVVAGDEPDVELGEGIGVGAQGDEQQNGVVAVGKQADRSTNLDEELDNWDENAEDPWDEEEDQVSGIKSGEGNGEPTPDASSGGDTKLKGKE